jgi:hypothetical protein
MISINCKSVTQQRLMLRLNIYNNLIFCNFVKDMIVNDLLGVAQGFRVSQDCASGHGMGLAN